MKKIKGYELPDPVDGYDLDCVKIRIPRNPTYRRAFWGHLMSLTQWFTWENGLRGDTRAKFAAEYWRSFLIEDYFAALANEGCDMPLFFRQNPDDPCLFEYRNSESDPWELAFDYGLCNPNESLIRATLSNTRRIISQIADLDTPASEIVNNFSTLNFYQSFNSTQAEDDRNKNALCAAISAYVDMLVEVLRLRITGTGLIADVVSAGLTVASLATAVFTGGVLLPAALALSAAGASLFSSVFTGLTETILDDLEARDEVKCLMFQNLKRGRPTARTFSQAFDGSLTGNAEELRSRFSVLINENVVEQYTAFLDIVMDGRNQNVPESCFCDDPGCEVWDFSKDAVNFLVIPPDINGNPLTNAPGGILGQYVPDVGVRSVVDQRAGQNFSSLVFEVKLEELRDVTSVTWEVKSENSTAFLERYWTRYFDENYNLIASIGQSTGSFADTTTIYQRGHTPLNPIPGVKYVRYEANGGTNSQSFRWTLYNMEICYA